VNPKKALRLDIYTTGAAVRYLYRIRWTLKNTPWRIRTVLRVYLNREQRNQLRARNLGSRVLGVDLDRDPIFNEMNGLFAIERIGFGITRAR